MPRLPLRATTITLLAMGGAVLRAILPALRVRGGGARAARVQVTAHDAVTTCLPHTRPLPLYPPGRDGARTHLPATPATLRSPDLPTATILTLQPVTQY